MKHVVLSLLAAVCGALSASAVDASNARIWLEEKIQPDFVPYGPGIASDKFGTSPAFARNWQYVSIPLHVEGVAKGDEQPHYIPELKVRISLAVSTADAKGKTTDSPELLTKEITYVDIPLAKHARKANMGESVVNVGVFVSPSSAFKLSAKDGNLAKKIIAVAVEGTFNGSACNRVKEKANENVTTAVIVNTREGRGLADNWWKKSGRNSGAALAAISETPFAAEYARLGFPPSKPMFGPADTAPAPASPASASALNTPSGPVSGTAGVADDATDATATGGAEDGPVSTEDEADGASDKTKRGKGKTRRRSSRN